LEELGSGRLWILDLQDCLQAGCCRVCAEVLTDTLMDAVMPPKHGWVTLLFVAVVAAGDWLALAHASAAIC
jgi:hypothetical protein